MNKRSVLNIINDDKNCFWYALACLMNPSNRAIRDNRNIQARTRAASELCKKCKFSWNQAVSFIQLPLIEQSFDCNIYIIDLQNIPQLGANIKLWNCLMYKSENRNNQHHCFII